ncbi:MAG: YjiH family protein, partial [Finegoldia magna]|nr:YjiH family protein [Finegoldia magna]
MKTNKKSLLNFLIPSIIGIIIFMIPVKYDGNWTIIVKILADFIAKIVGDYLPALCTIIITISFVMSIMASFNVKFIKENKLLNQTFSVTPVWLVLRILGFIVVWMVVLKDKLNLGPFFDMIVADESATFILNDLLTSLVIIFVIASMLLPLLLDFGLLEFIGAIFTKIMRPVFLIPG